MGGWADGRMGGSKVRKRDTARKEMVTTLRVAWSIVGHAAT